MSLPKTRNALSPLHFAAAVSTLADPYARARRGSARLSSVNRAFACGAVTKPAGAERPGEMAWFHGPAGRKNPRTTQIAMSDPPVVGNADRALMPESSETLVISRERRWLLRQDLNLKPSG